MDTLPLYKMVINEDDEDTSGVDYIALVDFPATEVNWQSFSNQKRQKFEVHNEEQRVIAGVAMVADLPIYRHDERGEYNVMFDADTIRQIVRKHSRLGFTNMFNIMHSDLIPDKSVYIEQSFIVDSKLGMSTPEGYEDAADGSWFIFAKVDNDEIWQKIKDKEFMGFSVEGIFHPAEDEETELRRAAAEME